MISMTTPLLATRMPLQALLRTMLWHGRGTLIRIDDAK
jgi:hypothetical protein